MNEEEELLVEKMVSEYRIKLKAMVCTSEPRTGFKVQEVDFKGHAQIIADYFGIDYNTMLSTIIHSIKKFNEWYHWDSSFRHPADDILNTLGYKVVKEGKENYHPERI